MKKHFIKLVSFALSLVMVMGMPAAAFAASPSDIQFLPSEIDEITDQVIEEYGVVSTDEYGNEIIVIPLGAANSGTFTAAPNDNPDDSTIGPVHEGHSIPDNIILPRHSNLTPHNHEVTNLSSYTRSTYVPATAYADEGFTVTKEYSRSVEINASLNLNGGITADMVSTQIGVSVGGSYSRGENESYSKTVPDGYKGRIVYYYDCTVYSFTNKTTYYWPNTIPQQITYEYDSCSAEGAPRNGYFGLQLIAK